MAEGLDTIPGLIIETPPDIQPAVNIGKKGQRPASQPPEPVEPEDEKKFQDAIADIKKRFGFYEEAADGKKPDKKQDKKADKAADQDKSGQKPEEPKADQDKSGHESGQQGEDQQAEDGEPKDDKPKSKKRPAGVTAETAEAIANAAARAAADAVANKKAETPQAKGKDESEPELDAKNAKRYQVFKQMEKDWPDKYKGISKQFVAYSKQLDAYRTKWEADHPDDEFNPEDSSHDQFYSRHEPKFDEDDYDEARLSIKLEPKLKEREAKIADKYRAVEQKLAEQEIQSKIVSSQSSAVDDLVDLVDKSAAKTLASGGVDALKDADPITFEALDQAAVHIKTVVAELERLSHPSGLFKFDPANPAHKYLDSFASQLESDYKSKSIEDRMRDGRLFLTQSELRSMPESDRGRYWTLDFDIIRKELVKSAASFAKQHIQAEHAKLEKWAKARGIASVQKPAEQQAAKPSVSAAPASSKPNSPSSQAVSQVTPSMQVENNAPETAIQQLVNRMFPE